MGPKHKGVRADELIGLTRETRLVVGLYAGFRVLFIVLFSVVNSKLRGRCAHQNLMYGLYWIREGQRYLLSLFGRDAGRSARDESRIARLYPTVESNVESFVWPFKRYVFIKSF